MCHVQMGPPPAREMEVLWTINIPFRPVVHSPRRRHREAVRGGGTRAYIINALPLPFTEPVTQELTAPLSSHDSDSGALLKSDLKRALEKALNKRNSDFIRPIKYIAHRGVNTRLVTVSCKVCGLVAELGPPSTVLALV